MMCLTHLNETGAFRRVSILWMASESQWGLCGSSTALAASNRKLTSVPGISKYIQALVAPSNHLHLQVNYFVWDFLSYIFKSLTCPAFNRLVKGPFLLVRKSKT